MPNISSKMYHVNRACAYCGVNLYGTPAGQWSYDTHSKGVHFHVKCRIEKLNGGNTPNPSPMTPQTSTAYNPPPAKPITPPSAKCLQEAKEALQRGEYIGAIKIVRTETNMGLDAVKAIVDEIKKTIEVATPNTLPNIIPTTIKKAKTEHYCFERLLAYMRIRRTDGNREDIYIPGAPGSGKSWAIKQAAKALELRYAYIALSEATQPSQIFGYMDATGKYVESIFFDYYKNGGVLDIAEMDNTNANVFSLLNNALDNGAASFPCGMIERHKDFIAIGNGNTQLRGPNALFPQRQRQDAASIARFTFIHDWGYDEELELALFPKHERMVRWVQKLRGVIEQRKDELVAGTREMRKIASLLDAGMDSKTAVLDGLFKGYQATKELLLVHPINF